MRRLLDSMAVGISAVCAVHCLLGPAALIALPVLAATPLADTHFHLLMLWLVVPASSVALVLGCKRHKDGLVLLLGSTGLVLLLLAATNGHGFLGTDGERLVTLLGSAIMVGSHLRNYRLCRSDSCSH